MKRSTPRLSDVCPSDLARDVANVVAARVEAMVVACSHAPHVLSTVGVYVHVYALAQYALTGVLTHASVSQLLDTIATLSTPAIDCREVRKPARKPRMTRPEPETLLGVVVMAAQSRQKLARDEPLTLSELAVLQSVSRDYLQRIVMDGVIDGAYREPNGHRRWLIPADVARRFLGIE